MIKIEDIITEMNNIIDEKMEFQPFEFEIKGDTAIVSVYFDEFDDYVPLFQIIIYNNDIGIDINSRNSHNRIFYGLSIVEKIDVERNESMMSPTVFSELIKLTELENDKEVYDRIINTDINSSLFKQVCLFLIYLIMDIFYNYQDSLRSGYLEAEKEINKYFPNSDLYCF